ncbi:MAG: endonuclease/exonuclease/phosphatase family protein [Bacteriovoracales bacterium]|nr:endonuclease/exonuclease/phosphatase family protein [Bacteriovoracales bacterium]
MKSGLFRYPIISFLSVFFLWGEVATAHSQKTFSVMTYNVENLFDTVHDEGKNDWEFLPLEVKKSSPEIQEYCEGLKGGYKFFCLNKDWNESVLEQKIQNISDVIRSYDDGWAPDIVVLQEVENMNVLRMLRDQGLSDQGFETLVLIEGPDKRGIDLAIMSRFPLYERPFLHDTIIDGGKRKSFGRGILEATFDIWGEPVTILANHWPSQGAPDFFRDETARILREVAMGNSDRSIIALGDFNTLPSDYPHAIDNWVTNRDFISHFEDPLAFLGQISVAAPGSYWYRGNWSYLDRIFVWDALNTSIDPLWDSFHVLALPWMFKDLEWTDNSSKEEMLIVDWVPWRFDPKTGEGYSDHFPLIMEFTL